MRGKERSMHLLISADESAPFLKEELTRTFPGVEVNFPMPDLLQAEFPLDAAEAPTLVFSRQVLPHAEEVHAESIGEWSRQLFARVAAQLPEMQPWRLHLMPHYGEGIAGQNRCRLIRESLFEMLQKKRRSLMKTLQDAPTRFFPDESLVQVLLMAPNHGFISITPAPLPQRLYRMISPFVKGDLPVASDKAAPSRAFAKLVEAELRLARRIGKGESCVDLGASPGSWSYVALQRGAEVTAVDRSPLREDLMHEKRLTFRQGDAFSYEPPITVDWLLCDVIAAPERSIGLLLDWLRRRWTRRFVVTVKFKGDEDYGQLERLKQELPPLCGEFFLTRLCANKNEACAFGVAHASTQHPT
jgi:23S rRNA (cytidine2498-2'-O)-methyltransferase